MSQNTCSIKSKCSELLGSNLYSHPKSSAFRFLDRLIETMKSTHTGMRSGGSDISAANCCKTYVFGPELYIQFFSCSDEESLTVKLQHQ